MFYDDEFDSLFKQMSGSFMNLDNVFEMLKNAGNISGPIFYGYTMTTGPDGKPVVNEYGNVKPDMLPTQEKREPLIDTLVDEKEKTLKVIAEMPGVEKSDGNVVVGGDRVIHIDAERGEKKYHVKVPIKHKVDPEPPKATYKNGILELVFKLEDEKSNGTTVNVL
jgi:HSP20 family protein